MDQAPRPFSDPVYAIRATLGSTGVRSIRRLQIGRPGWTHRRTASATRAVPIPASAAAACIKAAKGFGVLAPRDLVLLWHVPARPALRFM